MNFLLKGKTDKNIRLEDNDVLLVPSYGKRVEIVGEVRRNLLFEVKENETVIPDIEAQAYRNKFFEFQKNGVRFPYAIHRCIIPWLVERNITKFAIFI